MKKTTLKKSKTQTKIHPKTKNKSTSRAVLDADVFRHQKRVISRKTGNGELTLLSMDDMDYYFRLDSWAIELWTQLNGKNSVAKISSSIQKKSEMDKQFVSSNVKNLIKKMVAEKIITKIE